MVATASAGASNWGSLALAPGARYRVVAGLTGAVATAIAALAVPRLIEIPLAPYLLFFGLAMGGTFIVIHFSGGTSLAMQGSVTLAAVWLFGWEACVPINLAAATLLLLRNRLHPWRWLFAWSNTTLWMTAAGVLFQRLGGGTIQLEHSWAVAAVLLLAGLLCAAGLALGPSLLVAIDRGDAKLIDLGQLAGVTGFIFLSFVPVSYLMALGFLMGPGAGVVLAVSVWVLTSLALKGYAETGHANARLQEAMRELEKLTITDPLTGLFNRRHMTTQLELEVERHRRHGQQLSLLTLDLVGFKVINDRFGHPEGDRMLQKVGEALRARLRGADQAFRWGGDEFAVILPNTPLQGARTVAEALAQEIAAIDGGHGERLAASVGIATFPDHRLTPESLLAAADAALYQARATQATVAVASEADL